jgi:hypothetical protein
MDWIETIFGISPDGGDGATEAMIVTVVGVVLASIIIASPKLRAQVRRHVDDVATRFRR